MVHFRHITVEQSIPHIQTISTKLSLDHVAFTTVSPISKRFLPVKQHFHILNKLKKKNVDMSFLSYLEYHKDITNRHITVRIFGF